MFVTMDRNQSSQNQVRAAASQEQMGQVEALALDAENGTATAYGAMSIATVTFQKTHQAPTRSSGAQQCVMR